jgi:hypothetical protein
MEQLNEKESFNLYWLISAFTQIKPIISKYFKSLKLYCVLYIDNKPNYFVIREVMNLSEAFLNFSSMIVKAQDENKTIDFDIQLSIIGRNSGKL